MRSQSVLLMALVVAGVCILIAGCTSPGDNATQPTASPTGTVTPAATTVAPTATEITAAPTGNETVTPSPTGGTGY